VAAVDPNQFRVISHSVKKTDANDARNLALYLSKGLLPEVCMKDKTQAQIASLTQTRDTLVKLRTALKNKVNNILSSTRHQPGERSAGHAVRPCDPGRVESHRRADPGA
jgi:transposase